jgi:hypothetical protein
VPWNSSDVLSLSSSAASRQTCPLRDAPRVSHPASKTILKCQFALEQALFEFITPGRNQEAAITVVAFGMTAGRERHVVQTIRPLALPSCTYIPTSRCLLLQQTHKSTFQVSVITVIPTHVAESNSDATKLPAPTIRTFSVLKILTTVCHASVCDTCHSTIFAPKSCKHCYAPYALIQRRLTYLCCCLT